MPTSWAAAEIICANCGCPIPSDGFLRRPEDHSRTASCPACLDGVTDRGTQRESAAASVSTLLPGRPQSVSVARAFCHETLRRWQRTDVEDSAMLVTSELVTNALVHVGGPISVTLEKRRATVRIQVGDDSAIRPTMPPVSAEPDAYCSGRGLAIVAALSDDWGVHESVTGGKVIWADLLHAGTTATR